jgi:hypothetical protein
LKIRLYESALCRFGAASRQIGGQPPVVHHTGWPRPTHRPWVGSGESLFIRRFCKRILLPELA